MISRINVVLPELFFPIIRIVASIGNVDGSHADSSTSLRVIRFNSYRPRSMISNTSSFYILSSLRLRDPDCEWRESRALKEADKMIAHTFHQKVCSSETLSVFEPPDVLRIAAAVDYMY